MTIHDYELRDEHGKAYLFYTDPKPEPERHLVVVHGMGTFAIMCGSCYGIVTTTDAFTLDELTELVAAHECVAS